MAICSPKFGCVDDILTIIALLSVPHCFLRPKGCYNEADACRMKFSNRNGDHMTALNAYKGYVLNGRADSYCHQNYLNHRSFKAVQKIHHQLKEICMKKGMEINNTPDTDPSY